jgi:hypothetical protein
MTAHGQGNSSRKYALRLSKSNWLSTSCVVFKLNQEVLGVAGITPDRSLKRFIVPHPGWSSRRGTIEIIVQSTTLNTKKLLSIKSSTSVMIEIKGRNPANLWPSDQSLFGKITNREATRLSTIIRYGQSVVTRNQVTNGSP